MLALDFDDTGTLRLGVRAAALRMPVLFLRKVSFYGTNQSVKIENVGENVIDEHVYEVRLSRIVTPGYVAPPLLPWIWHPSVALKGLSRLTELSS